jgi:hypothetical protein
MHTIMVRSASKSTEISVGIVLHVARPRCIVLKAPFATTIYGCRCYADTMFVLCRITPASEHDVYCSFLLEIERLSREMYKKRVVNDGALLPQCWTLSQASKLGSHDSPRWGFIQGQVQSVARTNKFTRQSLADVAIHLWASSDVVV